MGRGWTLRNLSGSQTIRNMVIIEKDNCRIAEMCKAAWSARKVLGKSIGVEVDKWT